MLCRRRLWLTALATAAVVAVVRMGGFENQQTAVGGRPQVGRSARDGEASLASALAPEPARRKRLFVEKGVTCTFGHPLEGRHFHRAAAGGSAEDCAAACEQDWTCAIFTWRAASAKRSSSVPVGRPGRAASSSPKAWAS